MQKVLIANRGEIALRVIRACRDLGLHTVSIYSQADSEALHVLLADEAVCVGEAPSSRSYLKVANIIAACEITGADPLHPGYGFLSENANFASICESCGLTFIGPPSSAIALLGDKAAAKEVARRSGCPVIPGSLGIVQTLEEGLAIAHELGFPIFIKAVAGGGGKGIRVVHDAKEFAKHFAAARAEAQASFSNPNVYLEKMIVNPRHVEIQILADSHGNVIHLGERDCTIQRRRQKLIEEAPSPELTPALRLAIGEAAVRIAKEAGYVSAGTVEFLLDSDKNFYFMEVNTRIQVEHTVTEELTGVDLVVEQLRIAQGEPLSLRQEDVQLEGHVVQFRINAEDPHNGFSPSPGQLKYCLFPGGPHVRVDSACYSGYAIPPYYDSMIAKIIVKGANRSETLKRARRILNDCLIGGVHTTIPFHLFMLDDPTFLSGRYSIGYIDELMADGCTFTAVKHS